MGTHALADIINPAGETLGAGNGGPVVSGDARIVLSDIIKPMKKAWPDPDPVNGPLLTDTGMVAGAPATSGLTLYPWNSGAFNMQSQAPWTAPTGEYANNSGFSACWNASTDRMITWGINAGQPQDSNQEYGFVTDATQVTIVYMHFTYYETRNYHDMQVYADYDGEMRKITRMPRTGSTGNGIAYRTLTFAEAREREFRLLLPWNCHFIGIYVNSKAGVRPGPNHLLIATNGDSWNEPSGNVLATPIGGAFPTGTYQNFGLSQAILEATGASVILIAQGGTGYYNVGGTSRDEEYVTSDANGSVSVFMSRARMEDFATKFGDRNPLLFTIGGWNDGTLPPAPVRTNYAARVTSGIARAVSSVQAVTGRDDLQLMFAGIQPVSISGTGDARYQANLGIADACAAANPKNVIGYIDEMPMWADTSMSGQRGANVNSADTIHLHSKGAEMVANWLIASASRFSIPESYYRGMLEWEAA
jgi:hypothetical protein